MNTIMEGVIVLKMEGEYVIRRIVITVTMFYFVLFK